MLPIVACRRDIFILIPPEKLIAPPANGTLSLCYIDFRCRKMTCVMSASGRAPRRRESSVEEDATRRVVD